MTDTLLCAFKRITDMSDAQTPDSVRILWRIFLRCIPGIPVHQTFQLQEHEVKFIDLDRFCCGNPLWDLGSIRHVCIEYLFEKFHIHKAQAADVWKYFADEYFGGAKSYEEVESLVKPFSRIIGL